ncbi:MAG: hypothetical protein HY744_04995 [Deltaproteobacteria bacterium]|nr:hypothetical protein [Deltaproteobacteria bacterium]
MSYTVRSLRARLTTRMLRALVLSPLVLAASLVVGEPSASAAESFGRHLPPGAPPGAGDESLGSAVRLPQGVARALGRAAAVERAAAFGLAEGVALLGAYVRPGWSIDWRLALEDGVSYAFVAGGDDEARDLDLSVLDEQGRTLASDDATDAAPVALFSPAHSAVHVIRLALHDATSPSLCVLLVMRQGGHSVSAPDAAAAVAKTMTVAARLRPRLSVQLHEEDYQWALLGAVLGPGEEATIAGLHLEPRRHVVVAAAGPDSQDIDLLLRDRAGELLANGQLPGPIAALQRRTEGTGHKLTIRNVVSNGPSLVTAVVLDVIEPASERVPTRAPVGQGPERTLAPSPEPHRL